MKTALTIVRHGETEWNVAMRLQGNKDSRLTPKGINQAKLAARALSSYEFDKLITSDLDRAVQTTDIINEYHNLPVEYSKAMRERNFGVMEGMTRQEINEQFPDTFKGYMFRNETYQIPEGERLVDFYQRVTTGIKKIIENNQGKRILIISHGGVLDCLMRMIFDYPLSSPRRFSIFNAAINTFTIENNEWRLDTWGNIDFQTIEAKGMDELK